MAPAVLESNISRRPRCGATLTAEPSGMGHHNLLGTPDSCRNADGGIHFLACRYSSSGNLPPAWEPRVLGKAMSPMSMSRGSHRRRLSEAAGGVGGWTRMGKGSCLLAALREGRGPGCQRRHNTPLLPISIPANATRRGAQSPPIAVAGKSGRGWGTRMARSDRNYWQRCISWEKPPPTSKCTARL